MKKGLLLLLIIQLWPLFSGCGHARQPKEIQQALAQEAELRQGGLLYAPDEYRLYRDELEQARSRLNLEQQRFVWFRDFRPVTAAYREVLSRGDELSRRIDWAREQEKAELHQRREKLAARLVLSRELSAELKDRRLALPGLVRVELGLAETGRLEAAGRTREALVVLTGLEIDLAGEIASIQPLLARYADRAEIEGWRRQLAAALVKSRQGGTSLLVICKAERKLSWYREGRIFRSFEAGLGFRFLSPKLYGGDLATPEGLYRVARKLPDSRYFRALLIDYPNPGDRQRYRAGRRHGLVPKGMPIGGLIEIHGGGRNAMTEGCIALDDRDMKELFGHIEIGTPVLIIGTNDYDNLVAKALKHLL